MQDFNSYVCTGRLTRDIELHTTSGGKAIGKGAVAINRNVGEEEKTVFLDFTAWEKKAETLAEYTSKGSRLILRGRLEQDSWEKDGKKFSKILLVVEDFQFLDKKEAQQNEQK